MENQLTQKLVEQKFRSQSFIRNVVINISISCIVIGYTNSYFSAIDYVDFVRIFQITQYQAFYQGFLTGCVTLTASVGGFIAAYLLSKFSRRHCILLINFITIFILLGLTIKNTKTLIFFRLLQGFTVGIFTSIAPLYSKEFSPLQLNSRMGIFFQMGTVFGLSLGFFMSFFLSLFFSPQVYWRMVFIFPIFLISIQSYNLIYTYPYETPKYLLSTDRNQEALQLLKIIYKDQYVQERLEQLRKMFLLSSNRNIQLKQIKINHEELNSSQLNGNNVPREQKKEQIKYNNNKLAIYAAIHISTLQQFTGISVVTGYGAEIVKRVFPSLAKILPIFLHFQAVLACFLTIHLLKNYGRKTILQFGSLGCGIFTLMLGYTIVSLSDGNQQVPLGQGLLVLISMFTYRFVYGVTIGAVAFLYIPEIIEPNIMPFVIIMYWLCASLTSTLFPILRIHVFDGNPGPIFVFFGVYTLLSLLINHFILVQTKGRKQYEVRLEYDRIFGGKQPTDQVKPNYK